MNKHRNLTSSDWLLLSAYLDDQLSEVEKRQVDERLQSDPECRKTLDSLRHTSMMLRSLPVRRVPRNFTLSARSLPKKLIPSFVGVSRFSSAAAALLLAAVFALDYMQKPPLMSVSKTAGDMQPAAVAMEAAKAPADEAPAGEAPMIIFWGAPAPVMGAYGKGGGGAEGPGMGGGGAAPGFYGVGGGGAPEASIPQAAPLIEELPAAQATPYAEMPVPKIIEGQQPETELQAQEVLVPEPLTGSGPILGVRPPEERSAAFEAVEIPLSQPAVQPAIPFRLIEIVLAILLLLTAIPAWLLKRK